MIARCCAFCLLSLASTTVVASAQASTAAGWAVRGDTSGAPSGCSASDAIAALQDWFVAMERGDSVILARSVAPRFLFTSGGFSAKDTFVALQTVVDLVNYARRRSLQHERLQVDWIKFNYWNYRSLEFGPLAFRRSADDLGATPRWGTGGGQYICGQGISRMGLARDPRLP
jgi:hypothetical protein